MFEWRLPDIAAAASLVAAAVIAAPAHAAPCNEAIGPATAERVFQLLSGANAGDGCALERVATDKSELKVTWKKGGQDLEPALVVPTSCATEPPRGPAGKFWAVIPSSVEAACPASAKVLSDSLASDSVGEPVGLGRPSTDPGEAPPSSGPFPVALLAAGGAALALAVGGAAVLLRRRKRQPPPKRKRRAGRRRSAR